MYKNTVSKCLIFIRGVVGYFTWREQHLYGSSRLGIWRIDTVPTAADLWKISNYANRRQYELSNHLGNVMAVIGDHLTIVNDTIRYPSVFSLNDYYVFGATKRWSGSEGYRYGFNGKENDNELKGEGNQQDYGMRIYDPRLGKFLSVDPLTHAYPWNSTYSFAENDPINFIDLDGAEKGNPARPGTARGGRPVSYVEAAGTNTGLRLREGHRIQRQQALREELERERELPARERVQRQGLREGIQAYLANGVAAAQNMYGEGAVSISQNRLSGSSFESQIYQAMVKNPNYVNVAQQVTFVVTSSNGTNVRVRIDNVGVRKDGSLDLVEAKFSIHGITKDNVTRSLTLNQKDFFTMLINGDVASIKFVGGANKASTIGAISGKEITGKISSISIIGSSEMPNNKSNTSLDNTKINKDNIKE